jgi:flagellar biosynthesis GTPase FlhF
MVGVSVLLSERLSGKQTSVQMLLLGASLVFGGAPLPALVATGTAGVHAAIFGALVLVGGAAVAAVDRSYRKKLEQASKRMDEANEQLDEMRTYVAKIEEAERTAGAMREEVERRTAEIREESRVNAVAMFEEIQRLSNEEAAERERKLQDTLKAKDILIDALRGGLERRGIKFGDIIDARRMEAFNYYDRRALRELSLLNEGRYIYSEDKHSLGSG